MSVLNSSFGPERYFEEICKIPHGSFAEKAISDYIVEFARDHKLECIRDQENNVVVYKKGSEGYEDHKPLILQGHTDMVCEKDSDCDFDFTKDPLNIYVEDGKLKARGTTLGGDDGVAVAYMLAILEDDTIAHPPLECVFTVQEEVGCIGAAKLDFSLFKSKRMLNLDNLSFEHTNVSSSGSQKMRLYREIQKEDMEADFYRITVDGLKGGHSGMFIDSERGNAVKITARILYALAKESDIRIAEVNGGNKENAIPIYGEAIFATSAEKEKITETFNTIRKDILNEYKFSEEDLKIEINETEKEKVLIEKDSQDLLKYMIALPHGYRHRSMNIEGLITASENLASVRTTDNDVTFRVLQRAELESRLDEMKDEIDMISERFGFDVIVDGRAPSWAYQPDSGMRKLLFEIYEEKTGNKLIEAATHGGLETGYFAGEIPGIDIVTFGPTVSDYHTSRECLDLETFRQAYEIIIEMLKRL